MLLVYHYTSAVNRRNSIKQQFTKLNIEFEFFDAIDGRKEPHYLFHNYNNEKRLIRKGYPLNKGELGCFASHYLMWEKCLELNKPIIVIEDDAQLNDNFKSFYNSTEKFLLQYEYMRLFVNGRYRRFKELDEIQNFKVVRYLRGPAATRAYIITPSAAKKFSASAAEWLYAVDDFMDQFWSNQVACIGIMPGVVQNETYFDSTIASENRLEKKRDVVSILSREFFNLKDTLSRHTYNIKKH